MMDLPARPARQAEYAKYERAYASPDYRMGSGRMHDAQTDLAALPTRGAYLDVGCGRGEMLAFAEAQGFAPVLGVEVVPELIDADRNVARGEGHALPLPPSSFDVVTAFDVLEHVLPHDDALFCRELRRVARRHIIVTANNRSSKLPDGTELHINRRPFDEWDRLLAEWFRCPVQRIAGRRQFPDSPAWRADLT